VRKYRKYLREQTEGREAERKDAQARIELILADRPDLTKWVEEEERKEREAEERKEREEKERAERERTRSPEAVILIQPEKPVEKPVPVYKKWWFWTAVAGAVVVGAAVGGGVGATAGTDYSAQARGRCSGPGCVIIDGK
jgi:hypothetical protein